MVGIIAAAVVVALALAGSAAKATTTPTETSLSDPSLLQPATTIVDSSGDYITSDVSPDSTAPLTIASDGYPCANVGYNATVKWYTAITNWVSWTWRMHFGVYVCHDKVQHVNDLSASVISELPTWSYCGVVSKQWSSAYPLPYANVQSYMEGCFQIIDKLLVQKFPWARITIGGNGGLWARSTGVNS